MRFFLRFILIIFWLDVILSNTGTATLSLWPFPYRIETGTFVVILAACLLALLSAVLINLGEKKKK